MVCPSVVREHSRARAISDKGWGRAFNHPSSEYFASAHFLPGTVQDALYACDHLIFSSPAQSVSFALPANEDLEAQEGKGAPGSHSGMWWSWDLNLH